MRLDPTTLRRLWPRAPQVLVDAVARASESCFRRHELNTPLRVAHFMAQISHESGGGTITRETLYYTTPQRIVKVWPRRFRSVREAVPYLRNEHKLADKVYNGRMDNRPGTDDGYVYRGRGLLQITGRDSYREIGRLTGIGVDLENNPDLAFAPTTALEVAVAEFVHLDCLPWCDKDKIEAVTRRVNGGYTGLAERKTWLARWKRAVAADSEAPAPEPPQDPPAMPEPLEEPDEPDPPTIPRGSDEVLPPGVDEPDKTMTESKTGWATVLATIAAIGTAIGQAVESLKPLLEDPRVVGVLVLVAAGTGAFIWWDRRKRLKQDRPA